MSPSKVTAPALAARMADMPYPSRLEAAAAFVSALPPRTFDAAGAAALFDSLQPPSRADAERAAMRFEALPASPAAMYFRARLHASLGNAEAAAAAWGDLCTLTPCGDPLILLHAARAYADAGQWQAAGARLREALLARPDYTFYARARGLVEQVALRAGPGVRSARIAILGSATTSLLVAVLKTLCFRDRIDPECYEGVYGAYRQEILDAGSRLHRFAPDVAFIVPSWRDLHIPPLGPGDEEATVTMVAEEYLRLWETLATRSRCHIVQHAFDLSATESAGGLSARRRGGRSRLIRRINLRLSEVAPRFVSVLDTERVIAELGFGQWEDAALWHRARQHPSTRALPVLAEHQMAYLRAVLGLTRKVVVCDLDNTLWAGVIGEDGVEGIRVGGASPEGEAHAELQRYLQELRDRGILLAVASKNNPDEARLPFTKHPGMVLRLEDFAAFEANWDDKVSNLRRVADRLSLGTDSFVFLDDNPLERAWVRSQMPEVAVVELGQSPASYVRELDAGRHFEVLSVSDEDRDRADQYRREAEREALRQETGSLEEFLAGLHMEASCVPVSDANLARVTQLVNKTNQFNLTTRRYNEAQIAGMVAQGGWYAAFQLADRFGDHGLVGVMFCVPDDARETWRIDTWLLSCRVLGRHLERFMLDRAINAARAAGIMRLCGVYRATAKNALVSDLFDRLGFSRAADAGDEQRYELQLESVATPYSTFIADADAGAAAAPAGAGGR